MTCFISESVCADFYIRVFSLPHPKQDQHVLFLHQSLRFVLLPPLRVVDSRRCHLSLLVSFFPTGRYLWNRVIWDVAGGGRSVKQGVTSLGVNDRKAWLVRARGGERASQSHAQAW